MRYVHFSPCAFFLLINIALAQTKTIQDFTVKGNEHFSRREILAWVTLKPGSAFSEIQLQENIKAILRNYRDEGYYLASIDSVQKIFNDDSSAVSIAVFLVEGEQLEIGKITVDGNELFSQEAILRNFNTSVGDVLRESVLEKDIDVLIGRYERSGYPFAKVEVDNILPYDEDGRKKLALHLKVDEGKLITINEIRVQGNKTTQNDVIVRETRITPGETYNQEKVNDIKRRLDRLNFFTSVSEPELYVINSDTVGIGGLLIKVQEGNTNTFDGVIGYQPARTESERGYLTGLINISMRNLFGTARRADFRWHQQDRATQELELHYLEPWVFGYPVNIGLGFLQRKQDSTYISRRFDVKGDMLITENLTAGLLFNQESIIPSDVNAFVVSGSRTITGGAEIRYDTRDDVYNPTTGVFYRTNYQIGQKKIFAAGVADSADGSFTVQRIGLDVETFFETFSKQVVAVGLHGRELRSEKIEVSDLFRFGGTNTLRGYREDQFLASRLLWSNLEYRFSLARRSYLYGFFDAGYYLKPKDDSRKTEEISGVKTGYGIGVRIETALGIIGVSYALGQGDSFSQGKIHFGLVNDF